MRCSSDSDYEENDTREVKQRNDYRRELRKAKAESRKQRYDSERSVHFVKMFSFLENCLDVGTIGSDWKSLTKA